MKSLRVKNLASALLITGTIGWALVYLSACAPAALPASSPAASPTTTATPNPDQVAAGARETIESALLTEATATLPSTTLPSTTLPSNATTAPDEGQADNGEATATITPVAAVITLLIVTAPAVEPLAAQEAPAATATPDLAATKAAEDQRVATVVAERDATATAESKRIAMLVAEILTAQPTATATATATPDLAASATADMKRINIIVAATLTAQPTLTPTGTATWTPTATPDFAATATAAAQAMANSVAATLTAQPTATSLPTATPTLTATWTPTPDFRPLIVDYRRAERAALQSLDANVLAQLPVFASGEALAAVNEQAEALRTAGQYKILVVEEIQIVQVMLGPTIGVLTQERHTDQTFARTAEGDRLVAQEITTRSVVYGLINEDGRWKINRVRNVQTE